jgi:hypothetical protein
VDVRTTRQLRIVRVRVAPNLPKRRFEVFFLELVVEESRSTLQIDSSLRGRIDPRRRCVIIRERGLILFRGSASW